MFCPSCGKAVQDGAKFCGDCGRNLQSTKSKPEDKVTSKRDQNFALPPTEDQNLDSQKNPQAKNGLAVAGLILGIASAGFLEFWPVSVAAIIISAFAVFKAEKLRNAGLKNDRKKMAIWGLSLGLVYLIVWFLIRFGVFTLG